MLMLVKVLKFSLIQIFFNTLKILNKKMNLSILLFTETQKKISTIESMIKTSQLLLKF